MVYTLFMFEIISQNAVLTVSVLGILIFLLLAWTIFIEFRMRRFMSGKNGKNLEGSIVDILQQNKNLQASHKNMQEKMMQVGKRLESSARGIATIRFNAFGGRGESGAQSFATAIVAEDGEGVVISSMHTREQTRVFAKPIAGFTSEHELTEEETSALTQARKRIQ